MEESHLISMKKIFKNPTAVEKGSEKDVIKALKKVLAKNGTSQFMCKTVFKYANNDAPMLFIGAPVGDWKRFAKENKTTNDFVAGYCKLETDNDSGDKKLLLQVKMGKGKKPVMIKELNKVLLKKLGITSSFVDELEVHLDDDDKEDIHGDKTTEHLEDEAKGGELTDLQQAAFDFKAILENYKDVRDNEHDIDEVKDLYKDIVEWGKVVQNMSKEDKAKLKAYLANYKKILEGVKKVMKADEHIDDELEKVTAIVQKYVAIPDHSSNESKALVKEALDVLDKIEKFAKFVGGNDLLEQVNILKGVLSE